MVPAPASPPMHYEESKLRPQRLAARRNAPDDYVRLEVLSALELHPGMRLRLPELGFPEAIVVDVDVRVKPHSGIEFCVRYHAPDDVTDAGAVWVRPSYCFERIMD